MNLIKTSAIGSTNDYLKMLSVNSDLPNFTVVFTENQTQGKGQRGTVWKSNPLNSLTFSVFHRFTFQKTEQLFSWNILITKAIIKGLEQLGLTKNCVKWPNDILAGNRKICGILIENQIKNESEIYSVVGIGINVFDTEFEHLPQAGSILSVYGQMIDKMQLLETIVEQIKLLANDFPLNEENLWDFYLENLFRKNQVSTFELPNQRKIVGIIKGVNRQGRLIVLHEDDIEVLYNLKEIKLLY